MIKFKYYGHACFLLETDNEKLLFDPFLTGNPHSNMIKVCRLQVKIM